MKNRISAQKRQESSRTLFHLAVQGSIDQFAKQFGSFLLDTMPAQFLGNREVVYQAYVHAFLNATAQAISVTTKWDVDVERYSGLGRLDLVIQRPTEKYGALQEYKRIELTKKDKRDGYGDSQGRRLTKHADDALKQIETRWYRARMLPTVTELREYGIAFLGPYCAVTGRLLERKPGEGWIVKEIYTSKMDEKRRLEFYRAG
jgi:PD-(D/E)XK nuclease superfamily